MNLTNLLPMRLLVSLASRLWLAPVGALAVFSYAPFGWWPLLPLVLGLLFWAVARAASVRQAASLGYSWGLGFFAATIHWIYISLHDYGGMPLALSLLAVGLLAAFLALFVALACALAKRVGTSPFSLLLTLPASWLLSEWLRGWLFTGFPWAAIGYSQIPAGPLAGFAPVLGVYGVGGLLAGLAAGLALFFSLRWSQRAGVLVLSGLILLAGWGLSRHAWTVPHGQPLSVALLQGAISQDRKWGPQDLIYNLQVYADLLSRSEADLIVMPETAIPVFLHEAPSNYVHSLIQYARAQEAALILGVPRLDAASQRYYNAAVLLTDPQLASNYKAHLVPFGEFIPFRPALAWFYDNVLNMPLADFSAGDSVQSPLRVKDQAIAANICYEDVFGEEIIVNARTASILLNLSNLAWFDGSIALAQHGQISQTRALETGRPMLRATNTGVTAAITADGRYAKQLPERVPGILNAKVQGMRGETPYMRWGNNAVVIAALGLLLLAALASRKALQRGFVA